MTEAYVEPPGIGLAWLWMLPDSHPFYWAAVKHDLRYDLRRAGLSSAETSAHADERFYQDCLEAAGEVLALRMEAGIFYQIVRLVGAIRWPKPETDPEVAAIHTGEAVKKLRMIREAGKIQVGTLGEAI
jgi:hypothetical protein